MTTLYALALLTLAGCLLAAHWTGYLMGQAAERRMTQAEQRADEAEALRLEEDTMLTARACAQWVKAAEQGRARVSTGSGRLVVVKSEGAKLVRHCPWCGVRFYYWVDGLEVMTAGGRAHREAGRASL